MNIEVATKKNMLMFDCFEVGSKTLHNFVAGCKIIKKEKALDGKSFTLTLEVPK